MGVPDMVNNCLTPFSNVGDLLPPLKLRGGMEGLRSAPIRDLTTPPTPSYSKRGTPTIASISPLSCVLTLSPNICYPTPRSLHLSKGEGLCTIMD